MTGDEISLKEHFDERFDDLLVVVNARIAIELAGVVRWRDLVLAISGVSMFVGLVLAISARGL